MCCRSRLQHKRLLPSHRLFGKTLAVRETTFLGFGSVFFFCQVNRSHVATNWEVFAYHYVNEISMLEKAKRTKTKRKQRCLKTLTPSGHGYRQSKLLGEAAVFRWGQVLRSRWHSGWLGSARPR